MFSNLTQYIFGGTEADNQLDQPMDAAAGSTSSTAATSKPTKPVLSDDEDWVVVEGNAQPSLTLGSLNEAAPRPPPTGSTGSSSTPSEVPEDEEGEESPNATAGTAASSSTQLSRSERRLATPFGGCSASSLSQVKAVRAAQKSKDKAKAKTLSLKALDRRNKAVKSNQSKKQYHASLNLRPANGKQLKQC